MLLSLACLAGAQARPDQGLPATVSPRLATAQDLGPVPDNQILPRVVLWLGPTPAQQATLDLLLRQQRDPMSPEYHHWLSPEEFAARFGASSGTRAAVQTWGLSHGWNLLEVARGGNYVAFSAPAAAVESALNVTIHREVAGARTHFANLNEPSLPPALSGVVTAITGLSDFRPHAAVHRPLAAAWRRPEQNERPLPGNKATAPSDQAARVSPAGRPQRERPESGLEYPAQGSGGMSPAALATTYDLGPLYQQGITGAGETLVIVGQATVDPADLQAFSSGFSLTDSTPTLTLVPGETPPSQSEDLMEADLDLEWAGAVAPGASINYVYGDSAFDALEYAVTQKLGSVVSVSFTSCEPQQSAAAVAALRASIQQGNSQGMTVVAAAGDAGAAGCDTTPHETAASLGLQVNLPASVPETTAIGGTALHSIPSPGGTYPGESAWNDTALVGVLDATGGGVSTLFTQPLWQQGVPGVSPTPSQRLVPDLAFAASPQSDAFPTVTGGVSVLIAGTSAATPIFAASLMLLQQYLQTNGVASAPGLGNINPNLYTLALATTSMFHDITTGDNKVPCVAATPNCPNGGTIGYAAGAGYDPVTGLGSLDLDQFVFWWAQFAGKPVVAVTPATLAFGSQDVGSITNQEVTIANSGDGLMPLGAPTITGAQASDFTVANPCPKFLLGGDQCTLTVSFKPAAAGAATAALAIAGATTTLATVALNGAAGGPVALLGGNALSFTDQVVGTTSSMPQFTTLLDAGQAPLTFTVTLGGTDAGDFANVSTCSSPLPSAVTCTMAMLFKPTASGLRTATLTIADNAPGSPHTIALSGVGVTPVVTNVQALAFDNQAVGASSPASVVALTNLTSLPVDLKVPCPSTDGHCLTGPSGNDTGTQGIQVVGANAADFVALSDCGTEVAPNVSCAVTVWFEPSAAGARTAALEIYFPGGPLTLPLSGTGVAAGGGALPQWTLSAAMIAGVGGNRTVDPIDNPALPTDNVTATESSLGRTAGLAADAAGDLFIAENGLNIPAGNTDSQYSQCGQYCGIIRRIDARTHVITTVAGSLAAVSLGDGGPATQAGIPFASWVAVNAGGDLFVAQEILMSQQSVIRQISAATGVISTIAGSSTSTNLGENVPALQADINDLRGLAVDAAGHLYLETQCSIRVLKNGLISTVAGDPACQARGSNTGPALGAGIRPSGMAFDSSGHLVLADALSGSLLTVDLATGQIQPTATALKGVQYLRALDAAGDAIVQVGGVPTIYYPATQGSDAIQALHGSVNPSLGYAYANGNLYWLATNQFGGDELEVVATGATALQFGNTASGAKPASKILSISNTGTATLSVSNMAISGPNAADFSLVSGANPSDAAPPGTPCATLVSGSDSCSITVAFAPSALGDESASLTITDNGPSSPEVLPLSGTGIAAGAAPPYLFTAIPAKLDFGTLPVGVPSPAQTVTIVNSGSAAEYATLRAEGNGFTVSGCDVILPVGGSCQVTVIFNPGAVQKFTSSLDAFDGGALAPLTGTGASKAAMVDMEPAALSFAVAAIGDASPRQFVTVSNTGSAPLDVSSTGFAGTNVSDFKVTANTCVGPVAPGNGCTLGVVFNPGANGNMTAALTLISNAINPTASVALTGATGAPLVALTPAAVAFGDQAVGNSSTATVTLANQGAGALNLTSASFTGPNAADFSQTNTCAAAPVAVKSACTVTVSFKPGALGPRSAALSLADNAPDTPQLIAISGIGVPAAPQVALSPAALTFAAQPTGTSSAAQTITLTNSGNASLTITSIAVSGAAAASFAQTNTCAATLAPAAKCAIAVAFTPAATGNASATLLITDNAGDSPESAALSGTGVVATLTLAPSSLTFATQATASSSAAQTITLTNSGTADAIISAIAASGDFAQTNNCGAALAAGANCTLTVTFTPTATGTRTGSLTVTDSAPGSPQTAALTGAGADLTIAPGTGASASSTIAAGQPATYPLSFTAVNGLGGTFTLSCTGAPAASTCTPSPATVTLAATPITSTITVTTTARGLAPVLPSAPMPRPWLLFALSAFAAALLALSRLGRTARPRLRRLLAGVSLATALACAAACGGGGGSAGGGTPPPPATPTGTPAGTYTLTVSATSGSGPSAVTRTIPLTLVVQ